MKEYKSFEQLKLDINKQSLMLVFCKSYDCAVCDAIFPKVKEVVNKQDVPSALVSIQDIPMFSGQYLIFTAPTLLIFVFGKEVFRQARILNIDTINEELYKWKKYIKEIGSKKDK